MQSTQDIGVTSGRIFWRDETIEVPSRFDGGIAAATLEGLDDAFDRVGSGDFEGGKAGAVRVLGKLGFTVQLLR